MPCCFATAHNTGARVSELAGLRVRDVLLDRQTAVHLHGKGRRQRVIPLWKNTATQLRGWLDQLNAAPDAPVFPNRAGTPMMRSGIRDRLDRAVAAAEQHCPSLRGQHVTPHTLRHSTAMHLLQSGTDLAVIALWLGHSSPAVTHQYLEADLAAKEAVLRRLGDPSPAPGTVPAQRPAPGVPGRPLIMCSHATGNHQAARGPPGRTAHNRELSRIGNVADHFLAGLFRGEVAVDEIGDRAGLAVLPGQRVAPGPGLAGLQAQLAHELADGLVIDLLAASDPMPCR